MALLKYTGPRLSTGEPARSLNYDGIPAGDVEEDDLTKEQIKIALASVFYERAGTGDKKQPRGAAEE